MAQPKITPTSKGKARPSILGVVNGLSREAIKALPAVPYQSWLGTVGFAVAVGIAYFMAALFGLALRANTGTSIFWPGAGISVAALIVWGPTARLPVSAGVVVATVVSNLMIGKNPWLAVAFGFVNAGQALLAAGLIERWFGRSLKLGDVSQSLGFLAAATTGAAVGAMGATIAVGFIEPTASSFTVWRFWFASCLLGVVTVAPLLVGFAEAVRNRISSRRELVEGAVGVVALVALSVFVISLPQGPWSTALPIALVLPVLLWVAVRCRPVFSAAAGFVVALTVIWSLTFSVGHFGDTSIALTDRILAAQTIVLTGAVLALVVAALFDDRRRSEVVLKQSNQRLQLALNGAELGAFSADFATGHLECDLRTARMHGHNVPPTTIKESRRFVHRSDLAHIDAAFAKARATGRVWNAEYRVVHPSNHPHAGETRWVVVESSIVLDARGMPTGLLGVTRDITSRKLAEQALAERNLQLALAGRAGRVGSFAYDIDTERMQISAGYAAIHGFPDGTTEIARSEWQLNMHPEDRVRWEALRSRAYRERCDEYTGEYRIVRPGSEIRWIEARVFVSYDGDGRPRRAVGVDIDVTARKRADEHQDTLNAELDHRVKNALATVSAIAAHTKAASSSVDDFVAALDGRIRSMATTHELLSARRWHGVSLTELVRRELAPYATRNNTEIGGPEVTLSAHAGQVVSMVLHELATNAAKHGALSVHDGRISVHWRSGVNRNAGAPIVIEWQESGGPTVRSPDTPGYGAEVIRDLIPYELGGTVDLAFASEGLQCKVEIPAEWVGDGTRSCGTLNAAERPLHKAS
jgi:PAS domain S-box-containing protein